MPRPTLMTNADLKALSAKLIAEFDAYHGDPRDFIRYTVYHTAKPSSGRWKSE